jgi:hypothetical protein
VLPKLDNINKSSFLDRMGITPERGGLSRQSQTRIESWPVVLATLACRDVHLLLFHVRTQIETSANGVHDIKDVRALESICPQTNHCRSFCRPLNFICLDLEKWTQISLGNNTCDNLQQPLPILSNGFPAKQRLCSCFLVLLSHPQGSVKF